MNLRRRGGASSATINPGASGYVQVTFTRPMVGMRDLVVRVPSNDADEPDQTLTLRFVVVP